MDTSGVVGGWGGGWGGGVRDKVDRGGRGKGSEVYVWLWGSVRDR